MAKIIRNSLVNFLVILVIFSLTTGWFFSGWPRIWQNPSIPPEIRETRAAETFIVITSNTPPSGYECGTPADGCFKLPSDWSDDNGIAVIGGGGGGGGANSGGGSGPGGGGGAGAFASSTVAGLTVGQEITFQIGGAGGGGAASTGGGLGGDTYFNGSGTVCSAQSVCAKGGTGGSPGPNGAGGPGGIDTESIGTTRYSGGSGSAGNVGSSGAGGGGGGAAGPTGAGGTPVTSGGGDANEAAGAYGGGGASGNPPGAGENGINLSSSPQAGSGGGGGGSSKNSAAGGAGGAYGGGGGGGDNNSGLGGAGGGGVIVIKYTPGITYCITRTDLEGTIEYGNEDLGQSTSTEPTTGSNQIVIVQNCGNQAKFNIKTSYSTNWTAISGDPSGQTDQFRHSFATTSPVINWQVMGIDPSYAVASSTVDANASLNVYLKIEMPGTDSSNYAQQSITVTVQAAAP